jgi:hypothetical protein
VVEVDRQLQAWRLAKQHVDLLVVVEGRFQEHWADLQVLVDPAETEVPFQVHQAVLPQVLAHQEAEGECFLEVAFVQANLAEQVSQRQEAGPFLALLQVEMDSPVALVAQANSVEFPWGLQVAEEVVQAFQDYLHLQEQVRLRVLQVAIVAFQEGPEELVC